MVTKSTASLATALMMLLSSVALAETITDWKSSKVRVSDAPGGTSVQVDRGALPRSPAVTRAAGESLAFQDPATGRERWVSRFDVKTDRPAQSPAAPSLGRNCQTAGGMGMGRSC